MTWLVLVVLLAIYVYFRYYHNTILMPSAITGDTYRVMDGADRQKAANMIAELDRFAHAFIRNMRKKYSGRRADANPLGYRMVANLEQRYRGGSSLSENPPTNSDTSYTLSKGQFIVLCLRERNPPYKLHSIDTLKYVFLHELAHVAMSQSDPRHSVDFWKHFKFILQEAESQGIYKPINYGVRPANYCGMKIKYNPLFDKKLELYI